MTHLRPGGLPDCHDPFAGPPEGDRDEWELLAQAGFPDSLSDEQIRCMEIGRQWAENSSLERWFPFTADRLKPLTDDQIRQLAPAYYPDSIAFARTIERAHGIMTEGDHQ